MKIRRRIQVPLECGHSRYLWPGHPIADFDWVPGATVYCNKCHTRVGLEPDFQARLTGFMYRREALLGTTTRPEWGEIKILIDITDGTVIARADNGVEGVGPTPLKALVALVMDD